MNRINRAKKVRENWKKIFQVDMAKEYFDGKQNPGYPEEEWITINKVYSHLKAQLPALYSADPYFYVKLRKSYQPNPMLIALWEKRGKIRASMLNYLKEESNLKIKARLGIQDAHFAYGVLKVHYGAEEVQNPDAGVPIKGESGDPLKNDQGEDLLEPDTIPINERYHTTRIHPDDFLWDEDAGPLDDTWSWLAQRIRKNYDEVKDDKRYDQRAVKTLEGKGESKGDEENFREDRKKGGEVFGPSEMGREDRKDKEIPQVVVLWEIYDLKQDAWTVIAEEADFPLIDTEPLPIGIEKHPYSILRFTLRDDSPYPIPPISPMLGPQKEYNLSRSRVLTHRKRFNRKYEAVQAGIIDEDEISKLESGDDGTIIRVQAQGTITPISDAPLDQMGFQEILLLNRDLIELGGGATDEARGIAGADTATQAGILDKRLEMKEGDAMSMVVDWVKVIAKKLDQLVQTHITRDEAIRVTGPQGEYWELVRENDYEEIEGEFEYTVNVGATVPRLPQMERNQWLAFLGLLSNFPHLLTSKTLLKEMAQMHHIENEAMIDELYNLGQQIMKGQVPAPGNTGSQPGVSEQKPASTVGGQMGGLQGMLSSIGG